MKILLIDAYDSFVHIIYQYLLSQNVEVDVVRNDKILPQDVTDSGYDMLVLGPGPGHPRDSGYLKMVEHVQGVMPIFGICLGMQAIVMAFGGKVVKSEHIMHGKNSFISHDDCALFKETNHPLKVARYHSLIAEQASFPHDSLLIRATADDDGHIMAVEHHEQAIMGVQFHPESIITENGNKVFANVIQWAKSSATS